MLTHGEFRRGSALPTALQATLALKVGALAQRLITKIWPATFLGGCILGRERRNKQPVLFTGKVLKTGSLVNF